MDRRDFLEKATAISGLAASDFIFQASGETASARGEAVHSRETSESRSPAPDGMIYRPLGRTGEKVSAIGLGGFHIGVQKDEQESIRIIRGAVDRGITFLDNSWDYHDGSSELRMGKALLG
jgi:uncharacterized protein